MMLVKKRKCFFFMCFIHCEEIAELEIVYVEIILVLNRSRLPHKVQQPRLAGTDERAKLCDNIILCVLLYSFSIISLRTKVSHLFAKDEKLS